MPDLGGGHELEHRLHHPEAGPEDRHEPDPVGKLGALHRLERRPDLERAHARIRERLVAEEP